MDFMEFYHPSNSENKIKNCSNNLNYYTCPNVKYTRKHVDESSIVDNDSTSSFYTSGHGYNPKHHQHHGWNDHFSHHQSSIPRNKPNVSSKMHVMNNNYNPIKNYDMKENAIDSVNESGFVYYNIPINNIHPGFNIYPSQPIYRYDPNQFEASSLPSSNMYPYSNTHNLSNHTHLNSANPNTRPISGQQLTMHPFSKAGYSINNKNGFNRFYPLKSCNKSNFYRRVIDPKPRKSIGNSINKNSILSKSNDVNYPTIGNTHQKIETSTNNTYANSFVQCKPQPLPIISDSKEYHTETRELNTIFNKHNLYKCPLKNNNVLPSLLTENDTVAVPSYIPKTQHTNQSTDSTSDETNDTETSQNEIAYINKHRSHQSILNLLTSKARKIIDDTKVKVLMHLSNSDVKKRAASVDRKYYQANEKNNISNNISHLITLPLKYPIKDKSDTINEYGSYPIYPDQHVFAYNKCRHTLPVKSYQDIESSPPTNSNDTYWKAKINNNSTLFLQEKTPTCSNDYNDSKYSQISFKTDTSDCVIDNTDYSLSTMTSFDSNIVKNQANTFNKPNTNLDDTTTKNKVQIITRMKLPECPSFRSPLPHKHLAQSSDVFLNRNYPQYPKDVFTPVDSRKIIFISQVKETPTKLKINTHLNSPPCLNNLKSLIQSDLLSKSSNAVNWSLNSIKTYTNLLTHGQLHDLSQSQELIPSEQYIDLNVNTKSTVSTHIAYDDGNKSIIPLRDSSIETKLTNSFQMPKYSPLIKKNTYLNTILTPNSHTFQSPIDQTQLSQIEDVILDLIKSNKMMNLSQIQILLRSILYEINHLKKNPLRCYFTDIPLSYLCYQLDKRASSLINQKYLKTDKNYNNICSNSATNINQENVIYATINQRRWTANDILIHNNTDLDIRIANKSVPIDSKKFYTIDTHTNFDINSDDDTSETDYYSETEGLLTNPNQYASQLNEANKIPINEHHLVLNNKLPTNNDIKAQKVISGKSSLIEKNTSHNIQVRDKNHLNDPTTITSNDFLNNETFDKISIQDIQLVSYTGEIINGEDWLVHRNQPLLVIERGSFGLVCTGIYKGKKVAIKIPTQSSILSVEGYKRFIHELRILNKCKNEGIVTLFGGVYISSSEIWIVMEKFNGTDLHTLRFVQGYQPKLLEGAKMCYRLSLILDYLHSSDWKHNKKRIVHRDIKPENILVERHNLKIAVCDFGDSDELQDDNDVPLSQDIRGATWLYAPPEFLILSCSDAKVYHNNLLNYTKNSDIHINHLLKWDIWSAGCVFHEMMGGYNPFKYLVDEDSDSDYVLITLKNAIVNGFMIPCIESRLPKNIKDIILQCLSVDINSRPTSKQLVNYWENIIEQLYKSPDTVNMEIPRLNPSPTLGQRVLSCHI